MLEKFFSNKKIIILVFSLIPLVIAYVSEYFFEIKPCKLCIYQRIPYIMIATIVAIDFTKLFKKLSNKITNFVIEILLIVNFSIAIFHYGIEKRFFKFQSGCVNNLNNAENFEDYKKMLANQDYVLCDQVSYEFLGVSMNIWNVIYTIFFFILIIQFSKKLSK
jgi:disulfide bond formation protein DsbB